VQVSETTTTGAVSRGPNVKDEAAGVVPRRGSARAGTRFREALEHGACERSSALAELVGPGANAPTVAPPRVAPPPARMGPAPAGRIDRVLVGTVGGDAEARIRIGAGALAGAEIRLTASVGSPAVTAQLLTPGAGSRQTLSVAMEEIRLRLRDKGITLAPSVARGRALDDARRDGQDGATGRGSGAGGGWPAGQ
jgi:hypothetical protein